MAFKLKRVDIEAGGQNGVYLSYEDAKNLNINVGDRVELKSKDKSVVGVVNLCRDAVCSGELGISKEVWSEGFEGEASMKLLPKPASVGYIRKRLLGIPLKNGEIKEVVFDLMNNRISSVEAAYFVASAYVQRLSYEEEEALTRAIVQAGETISFSRHPVIDKHCIGGVPGNRTTPIVVSIVSSAGYTFPKTSSRAITSPAGTADVMEVLCRVSYSAKELKKLVNDVGAAIIWGGSVNLAPVDDILLKLRYPLRLDPTSFLLASIIAKKKSVGSEKVLIDIPLGAKVSNPDEARDLATRFKYLGGKLGMDVSVSITDGFQPIGKGVGPSLEARDVIEVLQGNGPADLKEKSLRISGKIFEMVGRKNGYELAKKVLESGKAYKKFKEIIEAQEGNPSVKPGDIPVGEYVVEVPSPQDSKYLYYESSVISQVARLAGAPSIKGAGVELVAPPGSAVREGELLLRVVTPSKDRISLIEDFLSKNSPLVSRNMVIESF